MCVDLIDMWHQRARPHPTNKELSVQFGCHLEELVEQLRTVKFKMTNGAEMDGCETNMYRELKHWSDRLKGGIASVDILDRRGFLDAAADQVVTSVGVGHTANMKITEAIRRVNSSNWSKYDVDGKPIFDKHGKIAKGPSYEPPNLDGLF